MTQEPEKPEWGQHCPICNTFNVFETKPTKGMGFRCSNVECREYFVVIAVTWSRPDDDKSFLLQLYRVPPEVLDKVREAKKRGDIHVTGDSWDRTKTKTKTNTNTKTEPTLDELEKRKKKDRMAMLQNHRMAQGGNRDRVMMIHDTLKGVIAFGQPVTETRLMYIGRLSNDAMKIFLPYILENGLVEITSIIDIYKRKKRKICYRVTKKGRELIEVIDEMNALCPRPTALPEFDLNPPGI